MKFLVCFLILAYASHGWSYEDVQSLGQRDLTSGNVFMDGIWWEPVSLSEELQLKSSEVKHISRFLDVEEISKDFQVGNIIFNGSRCISLGISKMCSRCVSIQVERGEIKLMEMELDTTYHFDPSKYLQ